MLTIGFIGLGHMGGPMSRNLLKKKFSVMGFDLEKSAQDAHRAAGGSLASSIPELAKQCDVIFTMLPASQQVKAVCLDEGIFKNAKPNTLMIDSSSIDVATTRELAQLAKSHQLRMLDAPVSGGMAGAEAATLTFMVGGEKTDFEFAKPLFNAMGKNIFHAGDHGNGQSAKICNNMLLGISMIGVCEAFVLAQKLGLDSQTFFDICSVSSGQCWSLTQYCPVPGPVPKSPANRDYEPGFATAMMLKDLRLSQNESTQNTVATPMGALAMELYTIFNNQGNEKKDFSAIVNMISENRS